MEDDTEFLALERAIAPFAEGFSVRSGNENGLSGVYLHRNAGDQEIGIFAGLLMDETKFPHIEYIEAPVAFVMAYVTPLDGTARDELVDDVNGIFEIAHETLLPLASPEPFYAFADEPGALLRTRRLPEDAEELTDRRLLEFCRGSLALLGQVDLLDTLRDYEIE